MSTSYMIKCTCGHRMRVEEQHFGQTGKCTKCGRPVHVTRENVAALAQGEDAVSTRAAASAGQGAAAPVDIKFHGLPMGVAELWQPLPQGQPLRNSDELHAFWAGLWHGMIMMLSDPAKQLTKELRKKLETAIRAMDVSMQMLGLPFWLKRKWPKNVDEYFKDVAFRFASCLPRVGHAYRLGLGLAVFRATMETLASLPPVESVATAALASGKRHGSLGPEFDAVYAQIKADNETLYRTMIYEIAIKEHGNAIASAVALGIPEDLTQRLAVYSGMGMPSHDPALWLTIGQRLDELAQQLSQILSQGGQELPPRRLEDRTTAYFRPWLNWIWSILPGRRR